MSHSNRKRTFSHSFFKQEKLDRVVIDGQRHYVTPTGEKYKSVTTILGERLDKTALHEWRARVGAIEAQRISTQAANRGTAIHSICENYLLNIDRYPEGTMPSNMDTFKRIRPLLDENIGTIYGIEHYLYSDTLRTAGATDCIAEWRGIPSVIDFKTSRRLKKLEWIDSYLLQATAYALMFEERHSMHIPQIVIIIAVDHEDTQIFALDKDPYIDRVRELFI